MKVNKAKAIYEIWNNALYALYLSIWKDKFLSSFMTCIYNNRQDQILYFFSKHNFHKATKHYPILYKNQ